jgi:hypothetical protein
MTMTIIILGIVYVVIIIGLVAELIKQRRVK